MSCLSQEESAELAFSVANSEKMASGQKRHLSHVEGCARCKQRLAEHVGAIQTYRELQQTDYFVLTSSPCLDDNTLAEFHDHVLPPGDREQAEAHLGACDVCLRSLLDLADAVKSSNFVFAAPAYVIELAKKGLRLVSHPHEGFTPLVSQPAGVMGPTDHEKSCNWVQIINDIKLQFGLQHHDESLASLSITVTQESAPPVGSRITLRSHDAILQSEPIPSSGRITLHDLSPESYEIELLLPDGERIPIEFTIKPVR